MREMPLRASLFCLRTHIWLDVCQETRKSFIFREKIPCKIWLVGDECVPLHSLRLKKWSKKLSVLWKIYIEDK